MKLKHLLISSLCVSASLAAYADGEWLHLKTDKGWEVISLEDVDRPSFKGDAMMASDADGKEIATFSRSGLEQMYVNDTENPKESSGITVVGSDNATNTFSFDSKAKEVIMNEDGAFSIYNIDGALLLSIPEAKKGEVIGLSSMKAGVVILKSNNSSIKAILK